MSRVQRHGLRLTIVVFAILAPQVVLYAPSLFGGKIALPVNLLHDLTANDGASPGELNLALWDPLASYEPFRKFLAAEVRAGRMPLWNPYIFCGVPLFTNTFGPSQWPYYIWPDPGVLAWIVLLKSLVAGGGAFLFFRRVTQSGFWTAVFGAAIYPLTYFFVLWQYFVIGSACIWLPWLLLFTDATVRRPGGWAPVGVALTTCAIVLEGLGAPWPHMLLASGLYALWCVHDQYGWRQWRSPAVVKGMVAMACAWTLGGLLTAPQNLPAAEYLQSSNRLAARAEGRIEQPPAGWTAWEELVLPCHFGNMTTSSKYIRPKGNQLEGASSAYAGLFTTLVLAPLAFCGGRRQSQNWFWVGLGLFGFLYQADVPLVSEVFRIFPFSVLRNNRFTCYTGWAAVALAVSGLETLLISKRPWRPATWWAVGLIVAAALGAVIDLMDTPVDLTLRRMPLQAAWFRREYAWELAVCATALGAWWFIRSRRGAGPVLPLVLCGLTLVELTVSAWGMNPQCDRADYYPATPITEALRQAPPGRVSMGMYLRSNVGMNYGLSEIRGYDGADPRRIVQLFLAADPDWPMVSIHVVTQSFGPPRSPIMDMLALRYVFHQWPTISGAQVLAHDRLGWVEQRDTAMPRVWVPRRIESVADDEHCLDRLRDPAFNPRDVAYVLEATSGTDGEPAIGTAEIIDEQSMRVVVAAHMHTPGLLVLADAWDAGWKAVAGARELPVLRTNFLLRGVKLPAGDSTVEFRYEPASYQWGLRLFWASAVLLAGWIAVVARYGSRRPT